MKNKELKKIADKARKIAVDITRKAKAPHVGSASSIIEILTVIYFHIFPKELEPNNFEKKDRPMVILSKGHAVAALYAILHLKGYLDQKKVYTYSQDGGLAGHADVSVRGIDFSTGSLGHGLGIGTGIALARKIDKQNIPTLVILGDGECQEGEVWEAANFAAAKKIGNLVAIVDNNKWQGYDRTEDIGPRLKEKWKAFGWKVLEVDGHDIAALCSTIKKAFLKDQPVVIIAHTIKGKDLGEMENKLESHYIPPKEVI
ncbi:MAG: transketolase [Candidatus Anstonellaceae archaeon]